MKGKIIVIDIAAVIKDTPGVVEGEHTDPHHIHHPHPPPS